MMAEECRRLLDSLDDDSLRQVALSRMEGYNNDEIADQLGCARRTVARRLDLIRKTWLATRRGGLMAGDRTRPSCASHDLEQARRIHRVLRRVRSAAGAAATGPGSKTSSIAPTADDRSALLRRAVDPRDRAAARRAARPVA